MIKAEESLSTTKVGLALAESGALLQSRCEDTGGGEEDTSGGEEDSFDGEETQAAANYGFSPAKDGSMQPM